MFKFRKANYYHPLTELPGLGRHTTRALKLYGIRSIEQFALFTEEEIISLLGNSGRKLLSKAQKLCLTG